ncbi:hypothetical protein TrLO_g14534 [Triparma laevis f. longispina]|uniref:FAD-dependent oxidoreductase domain-containing protein 1 n=1 Tax=Triparma laevis f. longispina TaxID=1714387 RepID=A0A9W7EEQ7_9STRA|nr:hypothetical protein TrLO_g14534 [Triparma laevis f. longispina]
MLRPTSIFLSSSPRILIIGSGAIGLSSALHLLQSPTPPSITLVERDINLKLNSAVLSAGGVRSQFSLEENVRCSLYGLEVFKEFINGGYLFLSSTPTGSSSLKKNLQLQQTLGAKGTELLNPSGIKNTFPYLHTRSLLSASYSKNDGWFDPYSFLTGVRTAIKKLVKFGTCINDVETNKSTGNISRVKIDGKWSEFDYVINATGANANSIIDLIPGLKRLPIEARKRTIFHFKCPEIEAEQGHIPPLTVDPSGVWYRGTGELGEVSGGDFICGCTPVEDGEEDASDGTVDITPSYDLWDSIIWPKLYSLSSAFGSAKVLNQWAGWYEYNVIDQNGIVGFHPGCGNLVVANGFSGHGLQMSPAVGRAVAELVEGGRFETICLKRFGVERFEKGEEIFEEGIV